jgi:hypothetical protein
MEIKDNEYYTRNWMEILSKNFYNYPINMIILPGTNQSGSYDIKFEGNYNNDYKRKYLGKICSKVKFIGNIIKNWKLKQNISIFDQLNKGIRYLDLKISYDELEDNYYISDGWKFVKLDIVLCDIALFMNMNKNEIIILKISLDNKNDITFKINDNAIQKIKLILGNLLLPKTYHNILPTYKEMIKQKKRIILFYFHIKKTIDDYIWPSTSLFIPWNDKSELLSIKNNLSNMMDSSKIFNFISISINTDNNIDNNNIKKCMIKKILNPCCNYPENNLKILSHNLQSKIIDFISDNDFQLENLSGFIIDYPTYDMIKKIIELNL